jgi:transposase
LIWINRLMCRKSPSFIDIGRGAADRQHDHQGASLGCGRKMGANLQVLGHSRNGGGTKIHLIVDGAGSVLVVAVASGQMDDLRPAHCQVANPLPPAVCGAGTANDSNGLRYLPFGRSSTPVIRNSPTRKNPQPVKPRAYPASDIIERVIGRLKNWRRIHTRYDMLAASRLAEAPAA